MAVLYHIAIYVQQDCLIVAIFKTVDVSFSVISPKFQVFSLEAVISKKIGVILKDIRQALKIYNGTELVLSVMKMEDLQLITQTEVCYTFNIRRV